VYKFTVFNDFPLKIREFRYFSREKLKIITAKSCFHAAKNIFSA